MSQPDAARRLAIARTVHEAIRAWAAAHGQPAMPHWRQAPRWMKESTLESVDFVLNNPGANDGHQHDQWMDQKKRDGWVYGPNKDADKKTHPMMVPFADLPDMEKRKDALLKAVVLALA
ncbi:MAG: RyR domain-containing protein [Hyphomonadaceae bacterium]|nr:RyR domain-containing protein [Hyphomonadaceae bacterium]